jgi:hypothetical protein
MVQSHEHIAWCVRPSPSGRLLASASEDGAMVVVEAATGREIATFCPNEGMRALEWLEEWVVLVGTASGRLIPVVLARVNAVLPAGKR